MIRYLVVNGLVVAALWWSVADLSTPVRTISGLAIFGAIVALVAAAVHRALRTRSEVEGYPPQVIRHDGGWQLRRHPKSEEDPEFFICDHW